MTDFPSMLAAAAIRHYSAAEGGCRHFAATAATFAEGVWVSDFVVGRRGVVAVVTGLDLAAELVLDDRSVSGPDLIAWVFDELEHGEGDRRIPVIGDFDQGRLKADAFWLGHELGARL